LPFGLVAENGRVQAQVQGYAAHVMMMVKAYGGLENRGRAVFVPALAGDIASASGSPVRLPSGVAKVI
jgi:hypothetical protein